MKLLRLFVLFVLLASFLVAGTAMWIWNDLHTALYHNAQSQTLNVARGDTVETILNRLAEQGIIDNPIPLRIYLKVKKLSPVVQAGNYYFPSPITPLQVLKRLQQGAAYDRVTVIEGWTRFEIADALLKVPALKLQTRADALALFNNTQLIKDLDPSAQNLEGYLFPDTYFIVDNTSGQEVVSDMVKRFREIWKTHLVQPALQRGMNAHQVVTMASIVETEAKLKEERPIIASVIENRLARNMPLSMDSTLVYASKLAGAWKNDGKVYQSDIDRASPYNTRKNTGLPPGPVGSPGLSSLEAVVNPKQTDYLYYVRNPDRNDGAHNFYSNEKDFEVGVQALRAWEQRHR